MLSEENIHQLISRFKVHSGVDFNINDCVTSWEGSERMQNLDQKKLKKGIKKYLQENLKLLRQAQELLWASNRRSILVVFQAMDAAGKDSTINHVMSGVNPQGVNVHSFQAPSKEELDHNFLWRYWQRVPNRGTIGIFNRSYYEEVLIVKVHPEILESRPIHDGLKGEEFWKARYEDINAMERHLARSGTVVLKMLLHVSKEEQKIRFLERLDNPEKHWKFDISDIWERKYWNDYQQAFQDMIRETSTPWAPWFVIPADHKWKMRALVALIITDAIQRMDLKYPVVSAQKAERLQEIKYDLENE
jgi:PPK2 family polyphosphate:nucleotide phosphotransferase